MDTKYYLIEIHQALPYISQYTREVKNRRNKYILVTATYKVGERTFINTKLFEKKEWKNLLKKGYCYNY